MIRLKIGTELKKKIKGCEIEAIATIAKEKSLIFTIRPASDSESSRIQPDRQLGEGGCGLIYYGMWICGLDFFALNLRPRPTCHDTLKG
jgi:hypothetical protein